MSCHRTPGNNLHLNVAQYLSGAEPSDRRQIETLFHTLKRTAKERIEEAEAASLARPDMDPDARNRMAQGVPEAPSPEEVRAHLERMAFLIRNDKSIPDRRRQRLGAYCDEALAELESGQGPDPETWYAWQNLITETQRQQWTRLEKSRNIAVDQSVVTEQDVLEAAAAADSRRPTASHAFHRRHVSGRGHSGMSLDMLVALYDTTEEGYRRLTEGDPLLPDLVTPLERRLMRAQRARHELGKASRATAESVLVTAPSGLTQAQIRSAHNSFHVWRSACFTDASMTTPAPDRDAKWAAIEAAALEADRAARMMPARIRERAIKRRGIRKTIDPSYAEGPLPDWLERGNRSDVR